MAFFVIKEQLLLVWVHGKSDWVVLYDRGKEYDIPDMVEDRCFNKNKCLLVSLVLISDKGYNDIKELDTDLEGNSWKG